MSYTDGPTGIGGWMWLFLFGFGVVGPLVLVFGSYANIYGDPSVAAVLGSRWQVYQIAQWMIVGGALGIIGYIVWRLFKIQNRQTVLLTMIAIPVIAVGVNLLDIALTVLIAEVDTGLLFSALGTDLVRGVFYSVVWCAYFKVSKRVNNTYRDHDAEDTARVFE